MKEILGEIVAKAAYQCMPSNTNEQHIKKFVDSLIANGVTVQEWISVKEPPKEDGRYLVYITQAWGCKVQILNFAKNLEKIGMYEFKHLKRRGWWDIDNEYGAYERKEVTHWMPLPEEPKGEI